MPITAGIVGDPHRAAIVAGFKVTTEFGCAACRDRVHHPLLDAAEMTVMRMTVSGGT
jgi:hypothetical protein